MLSPISMVPIVRKKVNGERLDDWILKIENPNLPKDNYKTKLIGICSIVLM